MWSWLALILADTAMKAFGYATSNFVDQKQSKDATKMPLLGEMPDMPAGMAHQTAQTTDLLYVRAGGVCVIGVVLDTFTSDDFGVGPECGRLGLCQDSLPGALLLARFAWGLLHHRRRPKAE